MWFRKNRKLRYLRGSFLLFVFALVFSGFSFTPVSNPLPRMTKILFRGKIISSGSIPAHHIRSKHRQITDAYLNELRTYRKILVSA